MKERDIQKLLRETHQTVDSMQQSAETTHDQQLERAEDKIRQNMHRIQQNVDRIQNFEIKRYGDIASPESITVELELDKIRRELGI